MKKPKRKSMKLNKLFTRKEIDNIRNQLIALHGDKCAICKKPRSVFKNKLSVDHSHVSGRIRGLLCFRCNKFQLGRHTIESAMRIVEYLLKYDLPMESK